MYVGKFLDEIDPDVLKNAVVKVYGSRIGNADGKLVIFESVEENVLHLLVSDVQRDPLD